MKGMGKDKGMGLLIGIGAPKQHKMPDGSMMDDDAMEESGDDVRDIKLQAVTAMLSAIKGNDPEALLDAMDAYHDAG